MIVLVFIPCVLLCAFVPMCVPMCFCTNVFSTSVLLYQFFQKMSFRLCFILCNKQFDDDDDETLHWRTGDMVSG